MKKILLASMLLSTLAFASTQKVCSNGIIEDKNGLKTLEICIMNNISLTKTDTFKQTQQITTLIVLLNDKKISLASKKAVDFIISEIDKAWHGSQYLVNYKIH